MSKQKWYKNKETGEVVLQTGSNRQNMGTVFYRVRSGETFSETKSKFFSSHTQIEASGFPAEKPYEFKPRYAVYDKWSGGEAFVMEFEPGKFKVVMKDCREILRDEDTCKRFAYLFRNGWWKIVPEAEALARLDKPKPPVPAAEQFGPGPWYGSGLTYRQASFQEDYGFYVFNSKTKEHVGWVSYEVVQHLWDLGMVVDVRPRTESIVGQVSAILDLAKMATIRPKDVKPKKKVLVEWAIQQCSKGYTLELWDAGYELPGPGKFKTGRTVEVPE